MQLLDSHMRIVIFSICIVLLTGCFESDIKTTEFNQKKVDITEIKEAPNKGFSYLEQLPAERIKEYELFVKDRDTSHLQRFSPEQIVLIYMHSVAIADTAAIYALTYNDGLLADPERFRKDYNEYVLNTEQEVALKYRYYDSIQINEETAEENSVIVVITVSLGSSTSSVGYGLKKEEHVWKMDIQHFIEDFKQKSAAK
ncbi:hypothetical protein [Paenibacillus sp. 2TAB26]|uniref:hypothetical protein n=1 Tax=Paenibacillus sp. 2TAB26 TaxID=3233005 RepID=UPI003F966473